MCGVKFLLAWQLVGVAVDEAVGVAGVGTGVGTYL